MTLIIGCGNRETTTMVSDRRLTVNGKVATDESNKATILECADARMAISYSGLAAAGNFRTEQWILDALLEAGPPDFVMASVLDRFKQQAESRFQNLSVSRVHRRVTFVLAGYSYEATPPLPVFGLMSNWETGFMTSYLKEASDQFFVCSHRERRPAEPLVYAFAEGDVRGVDPTAFEDLRGVAAATSKPDALVGKSLQLLRDAGRSTKSKGTVGGQAMSVVIRSDPAVGVYGDYHTEAAGRTTYFPNQVIVRPDVQLAMMGGQLSAEVASGTPEPVPVVVPKAKRNHPCPCGSGTKYKYCHGRVQNFTSESGG